MATAPKGKNAKGEPIKVGDSEYVCRNLNDVLHVYDDILFPTYNKLVGLSEDASEQYNKLIISTSIQQIHMVQEPLIILQEERKLQAIETGNGCNHRGPFSTNQDMVINQLPCAILMII